MQPQNNVNLEQFKKQLKTTREFYILPTIIGKGPVFEKRILKHSGCIRILKAYEVNEEDNLLETAILPTDEPIIPDGSDSLEINKILARKRKP